MSNKYTLIKDEFSLWEEGQVQHNCVYTYKDRIINGECIIYKYLKDTKHYTIEIRFNEKLKYTLYQIYDTYNISPTSEDYDEVKTDIDNINKLIIN